MTFYFIVMIWKNHNYEIFNYKKTYKNVDLNLSSGNATTTNFSLQTG